MARNTARSIAAWVAIMAIHAGAAVAQTQNPAEREVKRPDGTVVRPIASPEPPTRPGYDPASPVRREQEDARRARAEETEGRVEAQRRAREEQLDRIQREREAAADTPLKRQ